MVNLTEFIYNSLNSKDHCIAVQIDYQKAFDTVQHGILLRKLERYGICDGPLKLFASFLSGRTQAVRYNKKLSSSRAVSVGIPQGTVLGPLLFLLYVNDMPAFSKECGVTLFADDTTLCFSGPSYPELVNRVCSELSNFVTWSQANRLSVHPDKTSYMVFSNRAFDISLPVTMNRKTIQIDQNIKILGVHLDNKLKFDVHISETCKKVSKNLGIIFAYFRITIFIGFTIIKINNSIIF